VKNLVVRSFADAQGDIADAQGDIADAQGDIADAQDGVTRMTLLETCFQVVIILNVEYPDVLNDALNDDILYTCCK
jgi:hypothetical protein